MTSGGEAAAELDLCPACVAELPYIEFACAGCALPLPPYPGMDQFKPSLCGHCLQKRPSFNYARAVFHYQSPIDTLILGLKFNAHSVMPGYWVN